MGEKVVAGSADLADRQLYRKKVRQCLEALEHLLAERRFDRPRARMGLEIELNLADDSGHPVMLNEQVLAAIASGDFQTELGRFNIEVNIAPHQLDGRVFEELREEIDTGLRYADRKARECGARLVTVGILPTLADDHAVLDNLSSGDRYQLLNDRILAARGEDIALDIEGVERLRVDAVSIVAEAACTSLQLHLQVTPDRFAGVWNAAQAMTGPQLALGANSPFLFGRELWRETRPILFEQACDTRPAELKAQGVRPITWFGERWIDSVTDLFEENLRYFPSLLPICDDEDPLKVLAAGGVPALRELRLHNGTIYRWNRPVYDVVDGVPHLRVENRALPAGPTVVDTLANAAFYYGLVRSLAEQSRPVWTRLPFALAAENFRLAARYGLDAELWWPRAGRFGPRGPGVRGGGGVSRVPVRELVLEDLLPLAHRGLDAWGVEPHDRDRYLGIIEQRCLRNMNGAAWQSAAYHDRRDRLGMERTPALAAMTRRYMELMRTGEPVHTWPVR
ncbi:glutamate--cysteine ligase [Streptacidiphilus sp. PB12-B1b]|uniref:glutamate--cysteine ligase n=1 Tax=Streptacidiphilus sp. PB12-B1b TaxID=2705012 RepID=UPI0015F9B7DF|nr:glutamate--cysteine ligase [Streptacidiphilus sp. PB12-B1b]QMU76286.1 glutamate--cysteine ligase [Streptacidiphilus sp. PB12-B1b]